MRKLRVGVVVNPGMVATAGGGFSYYTSLLKGINEYHFDSQLEIINIVFQSNENDLFSFEKETIYLSPPKHEQHKHKVKRYLPGLFKSLKKNSWVKGYYQNKLTAQAKNGMLEQTLAANKIDLLYYLTPEFNPLNFPFIITNWDIGHKACHAFPEFIKDGEYELREDFYRNKIEKALLIFCESMTGAQELKKYYAITESKIKVLPLFANSGLEINVPEERQRTILGNYNLEKNHYFLYPAQFWAHKNHFNLIRAFCKFRKREGRKHIKLVLCGTDAGNKSYIVDLVHSLQLEDVILLTRFVTEEELHVFYKNTISLVMPTFLGPTNMPLLEAAQLKCPVVCSALEGHKEMMGTTAIYFNPSDVDDIENAMNKIYTIPDREKWLEDASQHIFNSAFKLSGSLDKLNGFLLSLLVIRHTWA